MTQLKTWENDKNSSCYSLSVTSWYTQQTGSEASWQIDICEDCNTKRQNLFCYVAVHIQQQTWFVADGLLTRNDVTL